MANPVIIECNNGVVTGVASNVTTGFVKPLDRGGEASRSCLFGFIDVRRTGWK